MKLGTALNSRHRLGIALMLSLAAWSTGSTAATADRSLQRSAEQVFQAERAMCQSQRQVGDRQACLTDARAAYGEALRGVLAQGQTLSTAHITQRCQALPADDRPDCVARMTGQGSTSGSVEAGGIYRELKTYKTETPPAEAAKP